MNKAEIRRVVAERIAQMSARQRQHAERRLTVELNVFLRRRCRANSMVMAYYPLPDEPDLTALLEVILENEFQLCLPRLNDVGVIEARQVHDLSADLRKNARQILEPDRECPLIDPLNIALFIVPGRAFTLAGERLGRGGGDYDRYLEKCRGKKIALAYRCQIFPALPTEAHDQKIDEMFVG